MSESAPDAPEEQPAEERSASQILKRHAMGFLPALLLLPVAFAFPRFDLSGSAGAAVLVWSESGGKPGIPFVGLLCTLLLISRPGLKGAERALQGVAILGSLGVVMLAVAWANEHVVKPGFGIPRPDIVELAEAGALETTPKEFYALGDKDVRSAYLRERADHPTFAELHPWVKEHWLHETGFSFPSGHSQASMAFASYFFALAMGLLSGWRFKVACVLPAWGLLVCWSRPFLNVHSPLDITVGGTSGTLIGLVSFALCWAILGRLGSGRRSSG